MGKVSAIPMLGIFVLPGLGVANPVVSKNSNVSLRSQAMRRNQAVIAKNSIPLKVPGACNIVTPSFAEFVSFSRSLISRSQRCAEF